MKPSMATMHASALFSAVILFCNLLHAEIQTPAQGPDAQNLARLGGILKEAQDLQSTQLAEVPNKLAPLLAELRQLQQAGALTAETSKIFQDALLLQISAQTKLLAPEPDITATFRELLVVNPRLEDTSFNPREKLLLEKVRSGETGHLALKTEPPGIAVFYAGVELGATPVDLPLIAGTYRLLLRKEGYRDQPFEAVIRASEVLTSEQAMRRLPVDIPLSANAEGATVSLNGRLLGKTQAYDAWIASLPAGRQDTMRALVTQWGPNARSANFLRIPEVNIGEPLTIELQAPCFQPVKFSFTIGEQEVDWAGLTHVRPELRRIDLKRDTGFMEVTSAPSAAEVWIDGALVGKTPWQKDICVGTHRVQVLHSSGQYLQEVVIQRDQISKVAGELRPALLFLGVYSEAPDKALRPVSPDWETVARQLVLRGTAFVNLQLPPAEIEARHKSGSLPLEQLVAATVPAAESGSLVKKIAADNGRVDLFLFSVRAGGKYQFRLYSALHPLPDLIELAGLDESSLAFLVSQLNKSDKTAARLFTPGLGIEVFESPYGLAIQSAPAGRADLAPGSLVRAVDQKPMTFAEFRSYLADSRSGRQVTVDVSAAQGATSRAILSVTMAGAEYPWNTPDGFPNSILTMLHYLLERDPAGDVAKYAGLSLARGLMERGEWKLALEYLSRINLEPVKAGISPGTVLYYQGRCHEELGDATNALAFYARARDCPDATLGTRNGLSIPILAERRIQNLKRQSR